MPICVNRVEMGFIMDKRKIIIVDDIMFHLLSIKERLKEHYIIYPAQTTDMMFHHINKIDPELIILDINMPKSDGYKAIEQLKADDRYNHIPVIFLTSQKDKESLMKAMSLGAVDYLIKPVTDTELIESIEHILNPGSSNALKPVILAVDDSPTILKSVNVFLRDKYTVYTLPEPEKLKELLAMINPDLFILDCNMPFISGFDLVPIIRGYSEYADTPIIFLTGEGTRDNLFVATQLGASDFLVKPINENMLREKVANHLEGFVIRRRLIKMAQSF